MITGNTNEKVLKSGKYYCKAHNSITEDLLEGNTFPKCKDGNHDTEWIFKQAENENSTNKSGTKETVNTGNKENEGEKKEPEIKSEDNNKTPNDSKSTSPLQSFERTYKKVGFFAAIHHINYPNVSEYALYEVLKSERDLSDTEIKALEEQCSRRLEVVKKEFDNFITLINEKERMKEEFRAVLQKMGDEYDSIMAEVKEYYKQLRDEIKSFGSSKENMISKRIEEFEKEINKIIEIYHNIETKQNEKFRTDFTVKNIQEKDKKFYYEYRDNLETSFNDIESRLTILRGEGLSNISAHFLVVIGWVAAFITSWFFCVWYSGDSSPSILVYILDNLRSFVLNYGWAWSLLVFLGYLGVILLISWLCYGGLKKWDFIKKKSNKKPNKKTEEEENDIEFSVDKKINFRSKFKAETAFEMWLKITPYLAIILLLLIILALGSAPGNKGSYANLSNGLFVQLIGLLLPISTTVLGFLYIIRFVERRNESKEKKGTSWEIIFTMLSFFALIVLLIADRFSSSLDNKRLIGAWGVFIGCISTSLALGYAYRFFSLIESSNVVGSDIDNINRYIEFNFYPWEISYMKYSGVIQRMKRLYHSLLNLSESRNELAVKLLNLHYKPEQNEYANYTLVNEGEDEEAEGEDKKQPVTEEEKETKDSIVNRVLNFFKQQKRKWERKLKEKDNKIKTAEETIEEMKKDAVTMDELIYFPLPAAKIKEIKIQLEERYKRREELKMEVEGYYKNEKTYASLNQQIQNIVDKRSLLAKDISVLESELSDKVKKINELYTRKQIFIQEGYQVGLWFRNNPGNDPLNTNQNNIN